ncbi:uncharacterized protein PFL1_01499 [Pseudozyma flocculosa PF-1]|nr:uncharacterized protein PFL1_01499 [Pseudozyma flocculosa PF-1]EPQ31314.1 hypothetical protein PFL1_01499 [Pseudozyma flocculosa PF-1]
MARYPPPRRLDRRAGPYCFPPSHRPQHAPFDVEGASERVSSIRSRWQSIEGNREAWIQRDQSEAFEASLSASSQEAVTADPSGSSQGEPTCSPESELNQARLGGHDMPPPPPPVEELLRTSMTALLPTDVSCGITTLAVGTRLFETRPAIRPLQACLTASGSLFVDVDTGARITRNDLLPPDLRCRHSDTVLADTRAIWPFVADQDQPEEIRPGRHDERLGLFEIVLADVVHVWTSSAKRPGYVVLSIKEGSATAQRIEALSTASAFFCGASCQKARIEAHPQQRIVLHLDVAKKAAQIVEHAVLAREAQAEHQPLDLCEPATLQRLRSVADGLIAKIWLELVDRIQRSSGPITFLAARHLDETLSTLLNCATKAQATEMPFFHDIVRLPAALFSVDGTVYLASAATAARPARPAERIRLAWDDPQESKSIDWSAQRVVWLRLARELRAVVSEPSSPGRAPEDDEVDGVERCVLLWPNATEIERLIKIEAMVIDVGQDCNTATWRSEVEIDQTDIKLLEVDLGRTTLVAITLKRASASSTCINVCPPDQRIPRRSREDSSAAASHCGFGQAGFLPPVQSVGADKVVVCLDLDARAPSTDPANAAHLAQLLELLRCELGDERVRPLEKEEAKRLSAALGV